MYRKTTLENGVRIISERVDFLRSVSLGLWVNTGSRDENALKNGITHFIEHMIFKGTRNRTGPQIAKELDAIGGLSNGFTGKEHTCFHARVLGKHFATLSDILGDIYLHSLFDAGDMELERQVILQEISMVEDTPDENVHELFSNMFWMDHPIGLPILGTGNTVSAIGQVDILNHMKQFRASDKILVSAAGNVDHENLVRTFSKMFESLEKGAPDARASVSPPYEGGVAAHYKDLEQVHICLGGEGPPLNSEKRFPCAILNTILGGNMSSRLFQEIREKRGLAYSIYSFVSSYLDTGVFGVYLATERQSVNPSLETIRTEIKRILSGDIAPADLDAAKEHLIGSMYLSSESADSRMMRIAKNELVFERYVSYEELAERLEKVTIDDVVGVTEEIFRDGRISLTTLGPFDTDEVDAGCLDFGD
jgi:predicted Zn-dependent peptidase